MPVKVLLPNAFQKHTNGTREIQSAAQNLPQLITEIETSFPALKPHLRDTDGKVRRFINFYVNEEDIRFLGNDTYAFKDGDEVLVIPSIAGGCLGGPKSPRPSGWSQVALVLLGVSGIKGSSSGPPTILCSGPQPPYPLSSRPEVEGSLCGCSFLEMFFLSPQRDGNPQA